MNTREKQLKERLKVLRFLNEKQRRVLAASEAKSFGRGGIQAVARIAGMSRQTIYLGIKDLASKNYGERIRKPGGGRKRLNHEQPELIAALNALIEPTTRGDPESPLRWTCKSTRNLASALEEQGFKIKRQSVLNILYDLGYSLQANRKTSEGKEDHPDRDDQFHYINDLVKKFLDEKQPVISVDTKKKELIGRYKNNGREWWKKGEGEKVLSHDFPDPELPKAVPYGVYDIGRNMGWVNVGIDADTAEFAVESIRQWWLRMGKKKYGKTRKLLICADSGGSNGYRSHLWKRELQKYCNRYKVSVTVCHFPPGTSKWNKIEHKMFSHISMNWRGRPLVDYQTVVNLIAATTTKTGLSIKVRLDKRQYQRGIKVPLKEINRLNIRHHDFHGDWNYTIKPQ
jgi:transposase